MEYYSVERKKEFLPFRTALMELENIMLIEISQVVKDKYRMISHISEINKTNKQAKCNQRRWGRGIMGERKERVVKEHV